MEQNLKQRLVGALVLISLAVIFLPLIFDRQQQRIDTATYQIPEKPAMTIKAPQTGTLSEDLDTGYAPITHIEQQKQAQDEASAQQVTDESADEAAAPKVAEAAPEAQPETAPAPAPTRQEAVKQYLETEKKTDADIHAKPPEATVPLAETWIIQVGAFSSQANADGLRNRLKGDGYAAFVKPMKVSSRTLYKVYVGPEIRRYRLEQQKSELERKYKVKALILQYIP